MTVAKRNKRRSARCGVGEAGRRLLANYQKPEDLIGENGLLKQQCLSRRIPDHETLVREIAAWQVCRSRPYPLDVYH